MMALKWASFDPEITNAELETIPYPDRGALYQAMSAFAEGLDIKHVAKNYGDGLMMIKASNGTSGRCLFFCEQAGDSMKPIALLFYKKESQDAPKHVIEAGRKRKNVFQERKRK